VGFFLEIAGIGRAVDLTADATCEFLHNSQLVILSDKCRSRALRITFLRRSLQCDLKCWLCDSQQQFAVFRFDGTGSFLVVTQDVNVASFLS
jgi:hypothetical protein